MIIKFEQFLNEKGEYKDVYKKLPFNKKLQYKRLIPQKDLTPLQIDRAKKLRAEEAIYLTKAEIKKYTPAQRRNLVFIRKQKGTFKATDKQVASAQEQDLLSLQKKIEGEKGNGSTNSTSYYNGSY